MAAVTVNNWIETNNPNLEWVDVTLAASGDTYVARKLTTVTGAQITENGAIAATDGYSATYSGNTVTFTAVGNTTPTLSVLLVGT